MSAQPGDVIVIPPDVFVDNYQPDGITVNSATPTLYSPECAVTFVAPPSGIVLLEISVELDTAIGTAFTVADWWVREGTTAGSGTVHDSSNQASDDGYLRGRVVAQLSGGQIQASGGQVPVRGLTPLSDYVAEMTLRVTSGSITAQRRSITVQAVF